MSTEILYNGADLNGSVFGSVTVFGQASVPASITVNGVVLNGDTDWTYDDAMQVLNIAVDAPLADPLSVIIV